VINSFNLRFFSGSKNNQIIIFSCVAFTFLQFLGQSVYNNDQNFPLTTISFFLILLLFPKIAIPWNAPLAPIHIPYIVFFIRMVLCPILITYFGMLTVVNGNTIIDDFNTFNSQIVICISFLSFMIGWQLFNKKNVLSSVQRISFVFSKKHIYLGSIFIFVGLLSLIVIYKDMSTYLNSIYVNSQVKNPNTLGYVAASFGRRLLPFGIIIIFAWMYQKTKNIFFVVLTGFLLLFSVFSLNRQSMIYPLTAFFAAFTFAKFKFKKLIIIAIPLLFILLIGWTNVRQRNKIYDYFSMTSFSELIQIYFHSAQLYNAPVKNQLDILSMDNISLHASFLESVPIIGKPFRHMAGIKIYNMMIGNSSSNDQVFPFTAEVFYNLGFIGVIIVNILIGYIYAHFNGYFEIIRNDNFLLKYCVFYTCLLYNATILLSVSVFGYFLFYLFFPVPIIFIFSHFFNARRTLTAS